jgi:hypothetical protein
MCVCSGCFGSNWDGFAPHHDHKILAHLEANGIVPPPRNAKGFLPRDG